ncbi:MAG: hypothetical protein UU08_C0010G0014 [Candidatus Uhrbacteria bacterium GW2011_GWE2_40_58]|nr:MAG: hypothetical protein UT94_C0012G0003 [Candidatus Uhrbacteria bacterium GW2011_GWF2_40_263]KKR67719.1 MAG: hypothetical protein UU08_C0010G0014 [Candidatus Uhrbacteria bacterium GW2011_GWE2_40_58]OGL93498.1 MAG: hypothetical protein A2239_02715 [Candidatus Uhrbacteria bacterium RIFOXYA2_FULL_40_9]OGL96631.1 MAG: hypothetical protein A2332_02675 [Candidatus Uhrbacteria bacterium RIFOXYB2_FULL_41_18]HBK35204.1 hypothetical protein [Candidatus Uhrbacteria bacterium]
METLQESTALEQAIFSTISWFSLFSYPVTSFEVWKWLWNPKEQYSLIEVSDCLVSSLWLQEKIQSKTGLFALRSNDPLEVLQKERHSRFIDASRKYRKVQSLLWFFSLFPMVQGIAAVNTLSWWQTSQTSDIDLLVIVKPGTLWITRFCLVFPFYLLKKRPSQKTSTKKQPLDPFCFSFFLSEDHLDLHFLQIPGGDPYLAYWIKSLVPLYEKDQVFDRFARENAWTGTLFPQAKRKTLHQGLSAVLFRSLPFPFSFFEKVFSSLQKKRLPEEITRMANQDTRVVISDQMLKFYVKDRREFFREAWKQLTHSSFSL